MQSFLELLAQNALGAALLAVVVLALMPIVRRPAARNAMWLIVFARLLLPPVWGVPLIPAKVVRADRWPAMPVAESTVPPEPVRPVAFTDPVLPEQRSFDVGEPAPRAPVINVRNEPAIGPIPNDPAITPTSPAETQVPVASAAVRGSSPLLDWWAPSLFVAWLIGFLFVLTLAIVRIRRFERGLRDAVRAPDEVQDQAERLARQMGLKRSPAVWLSPGRIPPMLWLSGLLARQARLIVPMDLFLRLDAGQRSALMAHELAHLRRGDPWVRWLELLSVSVYWWFPLLGFFRRQLRESEEQCCDGWVVAILSERKAYATALVETVEYLDGPDLPATPALASGASPVHNLQRRLTMIMRGSVRGRLTKLGALAALGIAVGALAFGPAFSRAQPDQPRDKKERPEKGDGDRNFQPKGEGKDRFQPKGEGEGKDRFQPKGEGEGKDRFQPKGEGEGKDRFQPKGEGKDRFQPKGEGNRGGGEEMERAMQELQRAREEAQKAMQRVRELEERIQQRFGREGRPGPMGGPNDGIGRGGERPPQDLQRQLEEMRRMIEELRREINRGPAGPDRRNPDGPAPKGQPDRRNPDGPAPKGQPDRKEFRPGNNPGGPGGPGSGPNRPGGQGGPGGREKLPQPPEKDN